MSKRFRVVGINFDHFHMGDLLRMIFDHPEAEIAGICDEQPERMQSAIQNFGLGSERVFTDYRQCLETTKPDLVVLCPSAATHGLWTKRVAEYGVNVMVEKPFAASLQEADEMAAAVAKTGKLLAINWPLRWFPSYVVAKRLIDEGRIGTVLNVHYYGGNRGPLYHGADKIEKEPTTEEKAASWFYSAKEGGGSLLDYGGYGTTIGTWFNGGKKPIEVTCMVDEPQGLEVDEHSITIARYDVGLSKFETRWGTFTDPWTQQPQPRCGFTICGTEGTIATDDYGGNVRMQTRERPEGFIVEADPLEAPYRDPIEYLLHCINTGEAVSGPLSVEISRIGQQIMDSAVLSAREKRTVPLVE
ncbi:MAG: Gfo/Idh/MocA family oxidoreductase [Verrucomicrobiaceae bacterium]|nr:MAG: Gfo/Idh/MocA family oxidoreductase [Verrucomicrobiaceae bacterium]